jgi:hypothetical protein
MLSGRLEAVLQSYCDKELRILSIVKGSYASDHGTLTVEVWRAGRGIFGGGITRCGSFDGILFTRTGDEASLISSLIEPICFSGNIVARLERGTVQNP